ncbi:MAG TPA: tetratricopeptide repeat protein [Candidatus Limnocylindrales bacterium]|nr:tetratricopeptide repeat protein [Candidatus Limnocylindrales bacterium]
MKTILSIAVSAGLCAAPALWAGSLSSTQASSSVSQENHSQTVQKPAASDRADLYYYFTEGHVLEQQFEMTGRADLATQAIDDYKKALSMAPDSSVVHERLAEIYAKSQHIRDAVTEAQAALKLDSANVDAHRLLARIYIRSLGDMGAGEVQKENLDKAIEQFQAIMKLQPSDSYSALWLARLYRFENEHGEAEKILRQVLHQEPDNGQALEQLSQLLIDEGRADEAVSLLSQAAADSSNPDLYDLLGDAYSQQKDYAKAEDSYRKAVDAEPDEASHRHGLAQALMSEDKYAAALAQFKKLSELEPGTSDNYLRMAELYRRLGQYDQAETSLLRAKQLAPGNLEVLYNEALLYEDQGRYDDAVKVLSDAIAGLKSQSSSATGGNSNALAILYEQLGRAYQQAQNYPAAIDTFHEMEKLGPDSHKRGEMLVIDAYRENREIDRAITEAKKALADSPDDQNLTVTLAMLYGEKRDTAEATKLLSALLHGNEGDQEIYVDLAQVQERGRDFSQAEENAQKAEQLSHGPSDKEMAWFMLGAIYEREKKFDLAEEQFRKVLSQNPENAPALNYYGYMLADRGVRLDEATSMIQRAVKQDPNNGAYLDSLGWAYYKQNKLAEAEEYLRKAVDRDSHDPTILAHLGDAYLKLGQNERAAETMERALSEWQKAVPADYDSDKVNELDAQLKNLKKHLAQKSSTDTGKPQ